MIVTVELNEPEVQGPSSAHLILKDPETSRPVAEIAVRGAGYIVLTDGERSELIQSIYEAIRDSHGNAWLEIPDREGGYHGEPPLWTKVAEEQAAKRGASSKVIKVGTKKVRVPQSLQDIVYPDGAEFGEDDIIIVPSRRLDSSYEGAKRFRRACKRARAQQLAFLAAQKNPEAVEEGEADEEGED